jgi:hypothetical protein
MVPLAVDEERRCAPHAAEVGGVHVGGDLRGSGVLAQVADELLGVQDEFGRVPLSRPRGAQSGEDSAGGVCSGAKTRERRRGVELPRFQVEPY